MKRPGSPGSSAFLCWDDDLVGEENFQRDALAVMYESCVPSMVLGRIADMGWFPWHLFKSSYLHSYSTYDTIFRHFRDVVSVGFWPGLFLALSWTLPPLRRSASLLRKVFKVGMGGSAGAKVSGQDNTT